MKLDATSRRVGTTFVVVLAFTLLLARLAAGPGPHLAPDFKPRPLGFDEPTGLPTAR
jgi:hypothetical protein